MPWVKIPPSQLDHLSLFGFDKIKDEGDFAWYTSPIGRMRVNKNEPAIFVDDINDAIQLEAYAVLIEKDDN